MTKKCQICGKDYKFCPECDRVDSYKKVVDDPVCYKIYMVIYQYRTNIIDIDKAKEEFSTIGVTAKTLSDFKLIDSVRNYVAEIVKEAEIETETEDVEVMEEEPKAYRKSKKYK